MIVWLTWAKGPSFFVVSIGGTILFFLWQFSSWKVDDAADCGSKFEVRELIIVTIFRLILVRQTETWESSSGLGYFSITT
jgi:hypothetical protein